MGRHCCDKAFEVTNLSPLCRAGFEVGSCFAVSGQAGAQVPNSQPCKVDAAAGCQPAVQVCKITAHAQPLLASRGCARPRSGRCPGVNASMPKISGLQVPAAQASECAGQVGAQVCTSQVSKDEAHVEVHANSCQDQVRGPKVQQCQEGAQAVMSHRFAILPLWPPLSWPRLGAAAPGRQQHGSWAGPLRT